MAEVFRYTKIVRDVSAACSLRHTYVCIAYTHDQIVALNTLIIQIRISYPDKSNGKQRTVVSWNDPFPNPIRRFAPHMALARARAHYS